MSFSETGIVAWAIDCGIISSEMGNQVDSYIRESIGDSQDSEVFKIVDCPKTGIRLWEFLRLETGCFLDWCFLAGLKNNEFVARMFNTYSHGRAIGIAQRVITRKSLDSENVQFGREYYTESAQNILNELAYGSTDYKFLRLETCVPIVHEFSTARNSRCTGESFEEIREKNGFLINGKYIVHNTRTAKMIHAEILRCEKSLVAITPNNEILIPVRRKRNVDDSGKVSYEMQGIDPTFSILRMIYLVCANAFFVLELGPQSRNHQQFAAEFKDSLLSSGKRETNVNEFETIEQSDEFSEQEKQISRALEITLGDGFLNLGILKKSDNLRTIFMRSMFENFCGIANHRPHFDHFRKMFRNFKKHVRRFQNREEMEVADKMPAKSPVPTIEKGFNFRTLFAELAPKTEKVSGLPNCRFGSRWAQREVIALNNGTELSGWILEKAGEYGQPGFYTDLKMVGGDGI